MNIIMLILQYQYINTITQNIYHQKKDINVDIVS